MKRLSTAIPDVFVLEPERHVDARGSFLESFNQRRFNELIGKDIRFVQDNQSRSFANVLRGLHYQIENPQAKLVRVLSGEIYDVAVDLRQSSSTFMTWAATRLSAENAQQMWIPAGFAHGFLVLSEWADVLYKVTDYYSPEHERTIRWDDKTLNIPWPLRGEPVLSAKDQAGTALDDADMFA